MSYSELFAFMDNDNSNLISIKELIKGCSPDIDNNNVYNERELRIGKQNAKGLQKLEKVQSMRRSTKTKLRPTSLCFWGGLGMMLEELLFFLR